MSHGTDDHKHELCDLYGVAGEHHRHHDLESQIRGLREDLSRAEKRIRELENDRAALRRILREQAAVYAKTGRPGMADPSWLAAAGALAGTLQALADAGPDDEPGPRGCACGEGDAGDCPAAWHGCDWHDNGPEPPEPEEYDPGPEADDEGGMSEYRHLPASEQEVPW